MKGLLPSFNLHSQARNLIQIELYENIRNKWLLFYGLAFFILSSILIYYQASHPTQAVISLLNLILLIVPLFTLLYASILFAESLPFVELIIVRNISRKDILLGKFLGLGLGLSFSFLIGTSLSLVFFLDSLENIFPLLLLTAIGFVLHFLFLIIAFLLVLYIKRKEMILGGALLTWFYFYILYDFLVFMLAILLRDYPLDLPILIAIFLNPIDLLRVALLLQLDISAIMSFSTALIRKTIGGYYGILFVFCAIGIWFGLLYYLTLKKFKTKEF